MAGTSLDQVTEAALKDIKFKNKDLIPIIGFIEYSRRTIWEGISSQPVNSRLSLLALYNASLAGLATLALMYAGKYFSK